MPLPDFNQPPGYATPCSWRSVVGNGAICTAVGNCFGQPGYKHVVAPDVCAKCTVSGEPDLKRVQQVAARLMQSFAVKARLGCYAPENVADIIEKAAELCGKTNDQKLQQDALQNIVYAVADGRLTKDQGNQIARTHLKELVDGLAGQAVTRRGEARPEASTGSDAANPSAQ